MNGKMTEAETISMIKQEMCNALDFIDGGEYGKAKQSITQAHFQFDMFMNQLEVELSELRAKERNQQKP